MIESILGIATPVIIAALGGLLTERAGVLNIGLEGLMLIGAFASVSVAGTTDSFFAGLAAGILASSLLAFLFAAVSLKLRANIFIAGLAVNLFAAGLSALISKALFHTKGVVEFSSFPEAIPLFTPAALLLVPLTGYLLFHRPAGLRIRAAGLGEDALFVRGVSPERIRVGVLTLSGTACGFAGAAVALPLGAYVPHLTGGRGWIALVVIFLGSKRPAGVLAASLLFSSAQWLSYTAQGTGILPSSLLLAAPFLITFIGMILFSVFTHRRHLSSLKMGRAQKELDQASGSE
jgi:general nucleoside transport system permease protein